MRVKRKPMRSPPTAGRAPIIIIAMAKIPPLLRLSAESELMSVPPTMIKTPDITPKTNTRSAASPMLDRVVFEPWP